MSLAIGVAHAAWAPGRTESLRSLLEDLPPGVHVQRSEVPETSWGYARRLWRWASEQDADAVCLLNDDVAVCDDFAEAIDDMLAEVPAGILSLHAQGEPARALAERGVNWVRAYNLTGPGNVATPAQYGALADYWDSTPDLQCMKDVNEDNIASQYMWDQQEPAWLPLPSPVKHRPELASTIGYDKHEHRVTLCAWDRFPRLEMAARATWRLRCPAHIVPWIENPWFPIATIDSLRRRRLYEATMGRCWYCGVGDGHATSTATNCRICLQCAYKILGAYMPAEEDLMPGRVSR